MKEQDYIVVECFVDLNDIMHSVRYTYSVSDTLIKYSKQEDSPISPVASDSIRLGAFDSYGEYIKKPGLVGDDTEGQYTETHDWTKRENTWERERRNELFVNSSVLKDLNLKDINFKMSMTLKLDSGSWLYCTSIDPKVNDKRIIQMNRTNPEYNFMTKIVEPTAFAQQLGYDFGKQIESSKDLKCDLPALHLLASTSARESGIGGYSIFVHHGPVVYLEENEKPEFIDHASKKMCNKVLLIKGAKYEFPQKCEIGDKVVLFVKDRKYEVQQEYRFVVSVNFHSPSEKAICLKASEDLKRFMSPLSFR